MDSRYLSSFKTCTVLAIASFYFAHSSRTSCPRSLQIEKGEDMTISCNAEDIKLSSIYWYKGDPSLVGPILRIENGVPGGKEYGKGHYNITSTGAMIIVNATVDHEGVYSFLAYLDDGQFEVNNVTINITVKPYHECPVIDSCSSCENCSMEVNRTGSLRCRITQSRPKITLGWNVKSVKGIETFKPTTTADNDYSTDTWNTSTEIYYRAPSCNQYAVLQCMAQDDISLLKYRHLSLTIYTENCTGGTTEVEKETRRTKQIFIVVASSVCVFVTLLTCFIYFTRRNRKNNCIIGTNPDHISEKNNGSRSNNSQPVKRFPEKVRTMISQLKDIYRPYCLVQGLPFGDHVPVDDLYAGCECEVTTSDGETSYLSSAKILSDKSLSNERQVLVLGKAGYGKTMFLKKFVKLWIDEEENDFVLLFTSLDGASTDTKLTELMKTNVVKKNVLDTDILEEVIKIHDCLILLDGLEHISLEVKQKSKGTDGDNCKSFISTDSEKSPKHITLGEILNSGLNHDDRTMTVWITATNREIIDKFEKVRICKVLLEGYSDEQIKQYITNACKYHIKSGRQNALSSSKGKHECMNKNVNQNLDVNNGQSTNMPISEEEAEKEHLIKESQQSISGSLTCDNCSTVCENCYMFLKTYGIISSLREKPAFLFLIARATIVKFAVTTRDVASWNIASLTDFIIECLISTFNRTSKEEICQEHFETLVTLLQDAALSSTFNNIPFRKKLSSDVTDKISKYQNMGLFQLTPVDPFDKMMAANKAGSPFQISFCHKYFQDYFAACSILKNPDFLQQLSKGISKCREEDIFGLLKFICNFQRASLKELCDILIKHKWFVSVIACLYETIDRKDEESIISKICKNKIIIRSLSSDYHRKSVLHFCKKCGQRNVKLHFMCFRCEVPSAFLKELSLSFITEVQFVRAKLTKEDFALLLTKGTRELSFIECHIEDLTTFFDEITNTKKSRPKVYRKQNLEDGVYEEFDYNTLKWEIGKFGKILQGAVSAN